MTNDVRWMALTREISPALAECELTHLAREPIDVDRARRQHEAYERALASVGCAVRRLPAGADMPDSVFIEDTAVIVDELAVVTRPGAESRRAEIAEVAEALRTYRPIIRIQAPGRLDGGDVLVADRTVFVGLSTRTNEAGVEQLRGALADFGYEVRAVPVRGCLHLKTAVTRVDDGRLLINRDWVPADAFAGWELIDVDPAEPFAANALRIGDAVIYPDAFVRTRERVEAAGIRIVPVPADELAKAEGGVTCCSLVFRPKAGSTLPANVALYESTSVLARSRISAECVLTIKSKEPDKDPFAHVRMSSGIPECQLISVRIADERIIAPIMEVERATLALYRTDLISECIGRRDTHVQLDFLMIVA